MIEDETARWGFTGFQPSATSRTAAAPQRDGHLNLARSTPVPSIAISTDKR